jgi:hypothetical protein
VQTAARPQIESQPKTEREIFASLFIVTEIAMTRTGELYGNQRLNLANTAGNYTKHRMMLIARKNTVVISAEWKIRSQNRSTAFSVALSLVQSSL